MSRRTSKSRLLVVIIAVAAVAVGLSVAFAFPLMATAPPQEIQTKEYDCNSVEGAINYYVVELGGGEMIETRRMATSALMDGYCNTPELLNEIGSMTYSAMGLVSYGCDVAAGKIDNAAWRSSLEQYSTIYCQGALLAVLERAEYTDIAIHDFKEELEVYAESQEENSQNDGEDAGPDPTAMTADIDGAKARLDDITVMVRNARSLTSDGEYYAAAKSLESANASLTELAAEVYS